MGLFNILHAKVQCPRCGATAAMEIEIFFGYRRQREYHLGDTYRWRDFAAPQDGGRPDPGNLDGEGYTECPVCTKDFFQIVEVRSDRIEKVRHDPDKKPYIP